MKYLVLLLLLSCSVRAHIVQESVKQYEPKFKAGDCTKSEVRMNENNEFSENKNELLIINRKILKVGKRNYLYKLDKQLTSEWDIKRFDQYNKQIDCKQLDF